MRPIFHVASKKGWVNDPNGPLLYKGTYHLYYQSIEDSINWCWGLAWGHATSRDLVHWQHLPAALEPSPGAADQDGCFSGCSTVDTDGVPTILYTGVKLHDHLDRDARATSLTCSCCCVEEQLIARAAPGDDTLSRWIKSEQPWLSQQPPDLPPLNCFRDPFVLERPCAANGQEWVVMIGSGFEHKGVGAALVYRSKRLDSGWRYDGQLCTATSEGGPVWECPVLATLPDAPVAVSTAGVTAHMEAAHSHEGTAGQEQVVSTTPSRATATTVATTDDAAASAPTPDHAGRPHRPRHFFSVSTGTAPSIYWIGDYADGRFDMSAARGPLPLDLGDNVYAPNLLTDEKGRIIMWLWLREGPHAAADRDYSGCISLPRVLSLLDDGGLHQQALPELSQLRCGEGFQRSAVLLRCGEQPVPLEGIGSAHVEVQLTLTAVSQSMGQACLFIGGTDAAVLYDLHQHRLQLLTGLNTNDDTVPSLKTARTAAVDDAGYAINPASCDGYGHRNASHGANGIFRPVDIAAATAIGGLVSKRSGDSVTLQIFIDHSVVEVFVDSGEVLSGRISRQAPVDLSNTYQRQQPSLGDDDGKQGKLVLAAIGGDVYVERLAGWRLASVWEQ